MAQKAQLPLGQLSEDEELELEQQEAQAKALAAQKGGQHTAFNGANVPGYDQKTGAVVGGSLDNNLIQNYGSGIREGIEGGFGMLGDLGSLISAGAAKLAPMLGTATPEQMDQIRAQGSPLPTTQDIQGVTNSAFGASEPAIGPTEQAARTVGNFGVAALGPGGVARKIAQVALPAAGSEVGARAADRLGVDESYGRAAGGILGGGAAQLGGVNVVKNAAKGAPTKELVSQSTDQLYTALRNAGIKYDSDAYGKTAQGIMNKLLDEGYRPGDSPEIAGVFKRVEEMISGAGKSPDFSDVDSMSKGVGRNMRSAAATQGGEAAANAWRTVLEGIHNFEKDAPFIANPGVSGSAVNEARGMARKLALRNIKQRALDGILEEAKGASAGLDAGIRNGVGKLLRSKYGKNLFTPEEKTALFHVQNGNKSLRALSKFGFDIFPDSGNGGLLPAVGNMASLTTGAIAGGPAAAGAAALGSAVVGTGAKYVLPKITKKNFNTASDAIRSGNLSSESGKLRTAKLLEDQRRRRQLGMTTAAGHAAGGNRKSEQ